MVIQLREFLLALDCNYGTRSVSLMLARRAVASLGISSQIGDLSTDCGFNAVGRLETGIVPDVPPNPDEVETGLRRKNVPALHSGRDFIAASHEPN